MKICAVIIAYNPDFKDLISNIYLFIDDIEHIIIWDNTPNSSLRTQLNAKFTSKQTTYLSTGKNEGIAYALNKSFDWAIKNGYDHILTMDQDSKWENFKKFRIAIEALIGNTNIAIFAPMIKSNNTILRCNRSEFVITSGSIYNLEAYSKLGLFRESFFIDEVDNEYCIRANINGYRIKIINDCYLIQQFGETTKRNFLDKYTANYSPMRTYHQIRNRIWVWKEYHQSLSYRYILRTILYQIIRRSFIIMFNEDSKFSKFKSIYSGIKDGIIKNGGKIEQYK